MTTHSGAKSKDYGNKSIAFDSPKIGYSQILCLYNNPFEETLTPSGGIGRRSNRAPMCIKKG